MIGFLLITLGFLMVAGMLINPKLGAYLIWPFVFLYPHLYLSRLGLLPWNIGGDDLFICLFFMIVVIRRNILGGVPLRIGLSVGGALVYLVIWTVNNLSGWSIVPELWPEQIYKPILKYVIFVLLTYSLVHTIDNGRDMRRVAVAFCVFLTLAGVTVILQQWFPHQMRMFTTEKAEESRLILGGVERAVGSLLNPNTACSILGMVLLMAISLAVGRSAGPTKVILILCIPVLLAAMVLTRSRIGALSLGLTLMVMMLFGHYRHYVGALGVGLFLAIVLKPDAFFPYWERIASTYNPEMGGRLGGSAFSRIDIWRELWATSSAQVWLLGQGRIATFAQVGAAAHSTYVGALFHHGLIGVVWFIVFFGILARRGLWLMRFGNEPLKMVATGIMWGMLLWSIAGLTMDMVVMATSRYVYLFYAVLIERGYATARQAARAPVAQLGIPRQSRPALVSARMPHA